MSDEKQRETSKVIEVSLPLIDRTRIELVGHARIQMKARSIEVADVIHAIRSPDEKGLPTQDGRKRYRWNKTAAKAIDVVFEMLPDRIRVITAISITRRIVERKRRP